VLINAWYNDSRASIGQFSNAYLSNRIRLLQRKAKRSTTSTSLTCTLQHRRGA
jgi:hypothetical protein